MKTLKCSIALLLTLLFFTPIAIGQVIEAEDPRLDFGSCADWWEGACSISSPIYRTGSVSIGSSEYADDWSKLQVNGNLGLRGNLRGLNASNHFIIQASRPSDHYSIGSYFHLYGEDSDRPGRIAIVTRGSEGDVAFVNNDGSWTTNLTIKPNGKVIIGDAAAATDGFLLSVAEGIQTQQVKVCASANSWCDYVFADDYELNPIEKVEAHIKEHKHLPNVPSAQEVEENGINVAEMDATLLRQVEELWLHMIELKKENAELSQRIKTLEVENTVLKAKTEK